MTRSCPNKQNTLCWKIWFCFWTRSNRREKKNDILYHFLDVGFGMSFTWCFVSFLFSLFEKHMAEFVIEIMMSILLPFYLCRVKYTFLSGIHYTNNCVRFFQIISK